jgi:hypothetical protein
MARAISRRPFPIKPRAETTAHVGRPGAAQASGGDDPTSSETSISRPGSPEFSGQNLRNPQSGTIRVASRSARLAAAHVRASSPNTANKDTPPSSSPVRIVPGQRSVSCSGHEMACGRTHPAPQGPLVHRLRQASAASRLCTRTTRWSTLLEQRTAQAEPVRRTRLLCSRAARA